MSEKEYCANCSGIVYQTERISATGKSFHKSCFKCSECTVSLKIGNYSSIEGKVLCQSCYKKKFLSKVTYSDGFGNLKSIKSDKSSSNPSSEAQTEAPKDSKSEKPIPSNETQAETQPEAPKDSKSEKLPSTSPSNEPQPGPLKDFKSEKSTSNPENQLEISKDQKKESIEVQKDASNPDNGKLNVDDSQSEEDLKPFIIMKKIPDDHTDKLPTPPRTSNKRWTAGIIPKITRDPNDQFSVSQSFMSFNTKLRLMEASEMKETSFYLIPEEEDSFFMPRKYNQEEEDSVFDMEAHADYVQDNTEDQNLAQHEVENEEPYVQEEDQTGGTEYHEFDVDPADLDAMKELTRRYEEENKRRLLSLEQQKIEVEPQEEEVEEFSSLWWFPALSRSDAEHLLARKNSSTFVIRTSSIPNHYALTRYSSGLVIHYLIEKTEAESNKGAKKYSFRLIDCDLDHTNYPSLNSLVESSPFLYGCKPVGLLN